VRLCGPLSLRDVLMPVTGVKVTKDRTAEIVSAIQELARTRILVGIPEDTAARKDGSVSNAQIGYWMEFGTRTVPARPSLVPGVEAARQQTIAGMKNAGTAAFDGNWSKAEQHLNAVGLLNRNSVVERINSNIPPPLSPKTVAARSVGRGRRRRVSKKRGISVAALAREEIALGEHGAAGGVIALVASGQFRAAVTWVLKKI